MIKLKRQIFKKIRIFNNFNNLQKLLKQKIDYTMSSISIDGLELTIKLLNIQKK